MIRFTSRANRSNQLKCGQITLRKITGCAVVLIAFLLTTGPAWALRSCPVMPTTIAHCCVADQKGQSYAVGSTVVEATGSCFEISARNVIFDLGKGVSGSNKGIGLHVLSTAANASIIGGGIAKFGVGLKTDAPNTFVSGTSALLNKKGVILNGRGAFVYGLHAQQNLKTGIILTAAASGSYLVNTVSASNGVDGIVLRGTTGVTLRNPSPVSNGRYGLWLKGASFNSVVEGFFVANAVAGAYLGCHANFPKATGGCSIPPSNYNNFDGSGSTGLMVGSYCPNFTQAYGIAIDKGNGHNHVFNVITNTDTSCSNPGDTVDDGYDGNGVGCHANIWYQNSLTVEDHTASSVHPFCME